jgi:hypothetical protein
MRLSVRLLIATSLLSILNGCADGPEKIPEPDMNPTAVAAAILGEYDKDANGELSKSELKACKGLAQLAENTLNPLDVDGSGEISAEELAEKFKAFVEVKRQLFLCKVTLRNRPLEGGTVTLIPEPFMGDSVPSASGEVDANGNCQLETDDGLPGVVAGLYKVEIDHPRAKVPSKYNTETMLGIAVDSTNPYTEMPHFKLR